MCRIPHDLLGCSNCFLTSVDVSVYWPRTSFNWSQNSSIALHHGVLNRTPFWSWSTHALAVLRFCEESRPNWLEDHLEVFGWACDSRLSALVTHTADLSPNWATGHEHDQRLWWGTLSVQWLKLGEHELPVFFFCDSVILRAEETNFVDGVGHRKSLFVKSKFQKYHYKHKHFVSVWVWW